MRSAIPFLALFMLSSCASSPGYRTTSFGDETFDWGLLVGRTVALEMKDGESIQGLVIGVSLDPDSTVSVRVGRKPTLLDSETAPVIVAARMGNIAEVKGSTTESIGMGVLLAGIGVAAMAALATGAIAF